MLCKAFFGFLPDLREAFIGGTFAPAKKGAVPLVGKTGRGKGPKIMATADAAVTRAFLNFSAKF
ncbi:hypothetical protein AGMMS49925_09170 [Deltaproteobacteria bacterium]|nr:hypothetical protein AGMMS49925_09170 [Deltaproteobacteria bacterium]